ncbi:MAG: hypothetical protein KDE31_32785 [Caldilineaceae bacterium]|nr:hypothetical protein [Caldilineaceae bacterium]
MSSNTQSDNRAYHEAIIQEARIDELLQLQAALNAGDDGRAYIRERLEKLYPADYISYCQRWRNVPGDHAPGRMLTFAQWQALTAELTDHRAKEPTAPSSQRTLLLQRALLLSDR